MNTALPFGAGPFQIMTVSPTQPYSGVCLLHSAPNRFERENGFLHAGHPGLELKRILAECGVAYESVAAMTVESGEPPPMGTKKLVLFGEGAMGTWSQKQGLDAHRGHVFNVAGIEAVATYAPVDFSDVHDHETDEEAEDAADAASTGKDTAPTMRSNYRFWARADMRKLLTGERMTRPVAEYVTTGPAELARILPTMGPRIFFDIETHPPTNTLQCFSVADDTGPVFTVGCYDFRGRAINGLTPCMAALAKKMASATFVLHNALFDLPFLAFYHGLPFGRAVHDTMLQHHRAFPEAEKSLAHNISYWINAPYHKSEGGCYTPFNQRQFDNLLAYNAKDVATTRAVYFAQLAHAAKAPGLAASFAQVNEAIYPNAVMCLTGIDIDPAALLEARRRLTKSSDVLERIVRLLTGIRDFNPLSPVQVGDYFHRRMHYPVIQRTDTGAPSTGGDVLYRLKQQHPENVTIDALIAYREAAKQLSMLGFQRFRLPESR